MSTLNLRMRGYACKRSHLRTRMCCLDIPTVTWNMDTAEQRVQPGDIKAHLTNRHPPGKRSFVHVAQVLSLSVWRGNCGGMVTLPGLLRV